MRILIVWIVAFLLPLGLSFGDEPASFIVSELLDNTIEAQRKGNIQALSEILHPDSLEVFRRSTFIVIDKLEASFSEDEVEEVTGAHRSDLKHLSPQDFFLYMCSVAWDLYPGLGDDHDDLERPVLLGVIPDGEVYCVLYRLHRLLESESDQISLRSPRILGLRQADGEWKVHSMIYANRIGPILQREILRLRRSAILEQDAVGNE